MARPKPVRYRFARRGERVRFSWFDTPDKVALGGVFTWTSITFFLLAGCLRVCWFMQDETPVLGAAQKPDLGKEKAKAPVRSMRKADTPETGRPLPAPVS